MHTHAYIHAHLYTPLIICCVNQYSPFSVFIHFNAGLNEWQEFAAKVSGQGDMGKVAKPRIISLNNVHNAHNLGKGFFHKWQEGNPHRVFII